MYLASLRHRNDCVSSFTAAMGAYIGAPYDPDDVIGDAFEIIDPPDDVEAIK